MVPRQQKAPLRIALALSLALGVAACGGVTRTHGTFFKPSELEQVQIGQSTQADVSRILGSPVATNNLEGLRWVYVGQVSEQQAFLAPEILKREVVIVAFDSQGRVERVRQLDLSDGIPMDPIARKTPTEGKDLTILQQMFSNVGRFSSEQN